MRDLLEDDQPTRGPLWSSASYVTALPLHFPTLFKRIRKAVAAYPKAAMFELAEEGYRSAFEQLIACIISIRTRDEAMIEMARKLFAQARTPTAVAELGVKVVDGLIQRSAFHAQKAENIVAIARKFASDDLLPCDREILLSLPGVGPKCANLVLGVACGQPWIGVDVHVHRVTNRWGLVAEPSPEKTMRALEALLPRRYWIEINRLLVPFGKHICTGRLPRCSACPVFDMCRRVGVTRHR